MDAVKYLDYVDGAMVQKVCAEFTTLDAAYLTANGNTLTDGWYVVSEDVTADSRITCTGDVHLILKDGTTLNATSGVTVNDGDSLTIYAQSEDDATMGALNATATETETKATRYNAGIGGTNSVAGTITINGGRINAVGGSYNGNGGAGIGSGGNNVGGMVTINGGIVNAVGRGGGAGIGGGVRADGGRITINGGSVTATGGDFGGAGIGGGGGKNGSGGAGGTITITGGTVVTSIDTSNSGDQVAIGGGKGDTAATGGSAGNITITGGTVTANGKIGGGGTNTSGTLTLGWADADGSSGKPQITASSYQVGTISYADADKPFVDATAPENPLTTNQIKALTNATIEPQGVVLRAKYNGDTVAAIMRGTTAYRKLETHGDYMAGGNLTVTAHPSLDPDATLYLEAGGKLYALTEDGAYTLPTDGKYMPDTVQIDYVRRRS